MEYHLKISSDSDIRYINNKLKDFAQNYAIKKLGMENFLLKYKSVDLLAVGRKEDSNLVFNFYFDRYYLSFQPFVRTNSPRHFVECCKKLLS